MRNIITIEHKEYNKNILKGLSLLAILTFILYFSISFISSLEKDASAANLTINKSSTHLSEVITRDTFKDNLLEIKFMNKNDLTCLNTFVYNKSSNVKCFMQYNS
jgi:hypothetical protein